MTPRFYFRMLSACALVALGASAAQAASLKEESNWKGGMTFPSDVRMLVYKPDKLATNPPVLAIIHSCGNDGPGVLGQAGELQRAADQYGFIIVVPDNANKRCWDTQSDKEWTRDGGGDSAAIKQMVKYAVTANNASAERVYATGCSSGAMMTQLLMGLYPDVFKGGAAMAGMPAGCRGATDSTNATGYNGSCAGGKVMHTPQEWGAIAQKLDPGYTGHHPRVQLFHGSADDIISPVNQDEATKEWTNVLGLSQTPTTTTTVTLGNHQATRKQWKNACGFLTFETFLSMGGNHGPDDGLFKSAFVVPFLGLDKTGAEDPEIAQCGAGGAGGGGGSATGGTGPQDGGAASGGAGGKVDGGTSATGGHADASASGGGGGTGGSVSTGGTVATGGSTGGATSTGGKPGTGGTTGTGGALGDDTSSGCNCALSANGGRGNAGAGVLVLGLALASCVRRRRGSSQGS